MTHTGNTYFFLPGVLIEKDIAFFRVSSFLPSPEHFVHMCLLTKLSCGQVAGTGTGAGVVVVVSKARRTNMGIVFW